MGKPKGKSQGLAYLQKARPEAIAHLLKFFKESGRHLEPKTRFLISVVTKVINFSPRGLEQYVRRALEEGATPDEVIDAVLCSYPCAGLTKVVDAIDVILDMGLPGFERLAQGEAGGGAEPAAKQSAPEAQEASQWVEVGTRSDLSAEHHLHVQVAGRHLAVFEVGGEVHAIDNLCPHKGGSLAHGRLSGDVITCPLHRWQFDVRTGVSVDHPGAKVSTYAVKVDEDGRIFVRF
jgi:NAD(P)H-dependent nitrite reductase small subunit